MLVIGDVHGCCDELILLHEKSVFENGGRQFHYVIAVGDLVNKGPKSMDVVRHFIQMSDYGWLSVRGNHDNGALLAALGDPAQSIKKKHLWMRDNPLSDEQITWMAELPYTIRIPGSLLNEHAVADTVIVHAALVPGLELEKQTVETMVNLRELEANSNDSHDDGESISAGVLTRVPWASLWKGPEHVIFGHDAKRGLQEYELATGLDTGAVYGKKMTGIILPQRKLVQVNALETHCHTDRVD